eukprot:COSAG05_NODE_5104_length_1262_cov_1.708512_1_plen_165_part_00
MFQPAVLHDSGSVWPALVAESICLAQANFHERLSTQENRSHMSESMFHICIFVSFLTRIATKQWRAYVAFTWAFLLLSRAARDPKWHPTLMPAAKACLWAAGHSTMFSGIDFSEFAAAASVALLGRNEQGLTLDQDTVGCVLRNVHRCHHHLSCSCHVSTAYVH